MSRNTELVDALCALGFSTYEARTYAGLLGGYGQTAYALSKETGVPQPKIYEALRRLEGRGAAVLVDHTPLRYSATPPDDLLESLRSDFQRRVDEAESAVTRAVSADSDAMNSVPEVITGLRGSKMIVSSAQDLIAEATDKVYLSAWVSEITTLQSTLRTVSEQGTASVVLVFGKGRVDLPHAQVYRHESTLNTVYPHHQNRHLALVVDGTSVLWATSVDNAEWTGLVAKDRRLVGLVRSYIRHDIFVQKIYARLGPEMIELFGPGLELLSDVTQDVTLQDILTSQESSAVLDGRAM